jgi:hypothetical protein
MSTKPLGVSKKFCLLDVAASSQCCAGGIAMTHIARVPAFDNLGNDLSPDVRGAPSLGETTEKPASLPPSASGEFLCLNFMILTMVLIASFCRPYPICAFAFFSLSWF